ncbi:LysE family transporter [Alicyclobacillus tolerans]|nr:LysE family transporter [Alicyclobacillus tolerans]
MSNTLNPKVAAFFLTFLPQFVEPGSNTMEQLLFMGFIYTGLAIVWFLIYVSFVNYLRNWLQNSTVKRMMERITGVVLVGFGLKLAFEK